jgi:alcohol dehydrogenase (cytochrome c)
LTDWSVGENIPPNVMTIERTSRNALTIVAVTFVISSGVARHALYGQQALSFSSQQSALGKTAYARYCAACHGDSLEGQAMAVPLKGERFLSRWGGQRADALMTALRRMPPSAQGSLDATTYTDLAAYLFSENGVPVGERELPADTRALADLVIPGGGATGRPGAPSSTGLFARGPSRLDTLTPVIAEMLRTPPTTDWLLWRRTYDGVGFSPLTQIDRNNVSALQVQWSWALPPGSNMMVPLIHDGVIFAFSFGDIVEAIDATSGDLLWRYQYRLKNGA